MKKLIFKKFAKDVFQFFLLVSISISLIVWVIQAVNFLDIVTEDGHGFRVYFLYTLLSLPKIFSKILPFVYFISLFYITSKYENDNELIIFWSVGIKKIELGNIELIKDWLKSNIYQHGKKIDAHDLVKNAVGQTISVKPLLTHLTSKFSEIYNL